MTVLFVLTLLADLVTLVITTAAAVRRPIFSYKLIAATACCATGFALYQVFTGRRSFLALLFTSVLVVIMMRRISLNLRRTMPGKKH